MNKPWKTLAAIAAGSFLGGVVLALVATSRRAFSPQDEAFMGQALQASMALLELSQLAVTRAESDEVQAFAKRLLEAHARACVELKGLAERKAVVLPRDPDPEALETISRLVNMGGEPFDHYYMHLVIKDHFRAITIFQRQKERGSDMAVVAFASRHLRRAQQHLAIARAITARAGYPLQF